MERSTYSPTNSIEKTLVFVLHVPKFLKTNMVKRWPGKTGPVVVVTFLASLMAVFGWGNGDFRLLSR